MRSRLKPEPGKWYNHLDKGQLFRVIAVEKDADLVEIQHFDGDLEALELAEWYAMKIEEAAEPEDWTGPIDDVETDDLGYSETAMKDAEWNEAVEGGPKPTEAWQDATPDDETDEWAEGQSQEELAGAEPPQRLRGHK